MGKIIKRRRSNQGEPRRMSLSNGCVSHIATFLLLVPQENEQSAQVVTF